jgi:hypothetical protein
MTEENLQKLSSTEQRRALFEQTNMVAKLQAEAEKKARDEKNARLKALRLAKQQDH